MKNNILKSLIFAFIAALAVGCSDDFGNEIKSIDYARSLSPVNFEAVETSESSVKFTWSQITPADSFLIDIFADDEDMSLAKDEASVPTYKAVVVKKPDTLLVSGIAAQTTYSARIKAFGAKGESKYTIINKVFKTTKAAPTKQVASLRFVPGTVDPSYTFGPITMNITDGNGKFAIDANTQYFGDAEKQVKYESRMKTGGASGSASAIQLVSTAAGKLTIAMRCSNGTDTRTVQIKKGEEVVAEFSVADAKAIKDVTIEGEEAPKTVYPLYTVDVTPGTYDVTYSGGVNIYGFDIEYVEGGSTPDSGDGGDTGKTENASLTFTVGTVLPSYTVGCVTMNINNGNEKFAVDANTQYFGDAEKQTKYESRLKTGGASGSSNGIQFVVTGTGKMTIAMRSSSSSAVRTVAVKSGDKVIDEFTVSDENAIKDVAIAGEEAPKTVFPVVVFDIAPGTYEVTYDGGINIYGIDVEYKAGGTSGPTGGGDGGPTGGSTYSFAGIDKTNVTTNGGWGTYQLDGVDVNTLNSEAGVELTATIANIPNITLSYTNSAAKTNIIMFGPSYTVFNGKGCILKVAGLKNGSKVSVAFTAKGSTAALMHAQSGCTGDDVENADKDAVKTATYTATGSEIQIKENGGGARIYSVTVE